MTGAVNGRNQKRVGLSRTGTDLASRDVIVLNRHKKHQCRFPKLWFSSLRKERCAQTGGVSACFIAHSDATFDSSSGLITVSFVHALNEKRSTLFGVDLQSHPLISVRRQFQTNGLCSISSNLPFRKFWQAKHRRSQRAFPGFSPGSKLRRRCRTL